VRGARRQVSLARRELDELNAVVGELLEAREGRAAPQSHALTGWGSGSGFRIWGCRVQDSDFRVGGLEFRVQGSGLRVKGLGFRV
jgi:hypothetical protein